MKLARISLIIAVYIASIATVTFCQDYAEYAAGLARKKNNRLVGPIMLI